MSHEPNSLIQYFSIRLPRYLSFYMAMTPFRSKRIRLYSKRYINSFWIQSVFELHIILAYSKRLVFVLAVYVVLLPCVRLSLRICAPSPILSYCVFIALSPSLSLSFSLSHSFFFLDTFLLSIFTFSYLFSKHIQTLLLCICKKISTLLCQAIAMKFVS